MLLSAHPDYNEGLEEWILWRYAYHGGQPFINRYLEKLSDKESDPDYAKRKAIAYSPSFAAAAVDEIKNSLVQRLPDVKRQVDTKSYREAVAGLIGGVDYKSSTMGKYVADNILTELLVMQRVGVLVDNHVDPGRTLADSYGKHPFLSVFPRESIWNWGTCDPIRGYDKILLKEQCHKLDETYGFPILAQTRWRLMVRTEKGVDVVIYKTTANDKDAKRFHLDIPRIPFIDLNIPRSLMRDTARYQVALLNLESSDIAFALKANFPFFYEFGNLENRPEHLKGSDDESKVKIGTTHGRKYPVEGQPPGFVNPNPETLIASMKKGEQIEKDIRKLVHLNLSSFQPARQSETAKDTDNTPLEAGLVCIGQELQRAEQAIAELWSMFEGEKPSAYVAYPHTFNLTTDTERRAEAERLDKLSEKVPSPTYRKAVKKQVVELTMGRCLTPEQMQQVKNEIDTADTLTSNPDHLLRAVELNLTSRMTASTALGFNGPKEVPVALEENLDHVKAVLEAQGGGIDNARSRSAPNTGDPKDEKQGTPGRGSGRAIDKAGDE